MAFAAWVALTFVAANTGYALPISAIALFMALLVAQSRIQSGIHTRHGGGGGRGARHRHHRAAVPHLVPHMSRPPELAERLLFQEALTVAGNAYAPYSGFAVGAVVVGPSGRSHHGVNVENASYPAGLCAERAALAAMVAFGERSLRYVAVAAVDGQDCLPCGLCLQALAEFGDPAIVARRRRGARRAVERPAHGAVRQAR